MPGKAFTPPIVETWMMWPERCSRRIGSAALVTHSGAEEVGLDLVARLGPR